MFVHCTYMIYINACDGHRTFFGADGFLHPLGPPRGWGTRIRGGFGSGEMLRGDWGIYKGKGGDKEWAKSSTAALSSSSTFLESQVSLTQIKKY